MKVDSVNNTKPPMITRIKQNMSDFGVKLKTLMSDVFQREEKPFSKYVTIDGVRYRNDELPNYIGRPYDYIGCTCSETKFYPEDLEKMKTMNIDERLKYKCKLMKEGKCYKVPIPNKYDLEKNNKK